MNVYNYPRELSGNTAADLRQLWDDLHRLVQTLNTEDPTSEAERRIDLRIDALEKRLEEAARKADVGYRAARSQEE